MNPLKFIDQIKDMYNDQDPGSTIPGPRNMADGGQVIGKAGGLVEPGVMYYGKTKVTVDGKKFDSVKDAAEHYKINSIVVNNRTSRGWGLKKALTTPVTSPHQHDYYKDKDFLKWAKKNYPNWKPGGTLPKGIDSHRIFADYEKTLAQKNKIISIDELVKALGPDNPYSANSLKHMTSKSLNTPITKNMSSSSKALIKKAKIVNNIIEKVAGKPTTLSDVYAPFKYLKHEVKRWGKNLQRPMKVWELDSKQIKKINTLLNQEYRKMGLQTNTINNIYDLLDDNKFMKEISNYDGKAVDLDSHMFKKVFRPGKGGEMAYAYMQLGRALRGEIELDGIKVDKKLGNKIIKSIAYDSVRNTDGPMGTAALQWSKFQMAKHFDNPNASYDGLTKTIRNAFKEVGMPTDKEGKLLINIDEIFPARTGQLTYAKGSGAYNQFVQFIDSNINQKAKRSFDGRMSSRLTKLTDQYKLAQKTGDYSKVEKILEKHEGAIENFYENNPKAKGKVNLTQFQWDAKNKKFLEPKQVFESQYKGSYKTIPEKIRKGMEKFYTKTGLSLDPGTARTLEAAQKEITTLDKKGLHKFLKQSGFNINKCLSSGGRVNLKFGKGVNTCITGVIEAEQKAAQGGNKISKAKFGKFGKLASKAGWFLGAWDAPIELAFALPHMLQGDKEAAKRATTFGLFGWGEKKLDEIKADSPEAYKYAKHIKDNNDWIDAWFITQDKTEELKTLKEGTGAQELALSQLNKANAKMKKIQEEYVGYVDEEGKFDPLVGAKGKTALQDYLREDVKKKSDLGLTITDIPFIGDYNIAPYKGGDPITNVKQYIEQKGEPYWKSGLEHAAEEAGVADLYDTFMQGADIKDPRDLYSELPLEYASGLAALEKAELEEGLLTKRLSEGFAGGGMVGIRKPSEIPPERGGLRSIMINGKKY